MNFIKLLNFEINRFIKVYVSLLLITIISQCAGVVVITTKYIRRANSTMQENGLTQAEFIEQYYKIDFFEIVLSLWFYGPIAICVAALLFYTLLIWYRDWFGKNTFIYRLLMLPTDRLNVFFAKAVSIFVMTIGLVSVQYLLLHVETTIFKWIVPKAFREDLTIRQIIMGDRLQILLPQSLYEFIIYYGFGFLFIIIIFTAIMFERSSRVTGAIIGALYIVLSVLFVLLPIIVEIIIDKNYLYPMELLLIEIGLGVIVLVASLFISKYLLDKKITV